MPNRCSLCGKRWKAGRKRVSGSKAGQPELIQFLDAEKGTERFGPFSPTTLKYKIDSYSEEKSIEMGTEQIGTV